MDLPETPRKRLAASILLILLIIGIGWVGNAWIERLPDYEVSTFHEFGQSCRTDDPGGINISTSEQSGWYTLTVRGTVQTPTPCYDLSYELIKEDSGIYRLDITSSKQQVQCVQCTGSVRYIANLRIEEQPGKLIIRHDGRMVRNEQFDQSP